MTHPDVETIIAQFEEEPEHTRHVALLADQLFLALKPWHGRGQAERELLCWGANLHDIGWSQSPTGKAHHKHSARLIREHDWQELPRDRVEVVAEIARYHRKALPAAEHADFQALGAEDQILVSEMAGILRVADALDRTHRQIVRTVEAVVEPKILELSITADAPAGAEMAAVIKKGDLLRRASGRGLSCSQV